LKQYKLKILDILEVAEECYILNVEKPPGFIFSPGDWVYLDPSNKGDFNMPFSIATSPDENMLVFLLRGGASDFKKSIIGLNIGEDITLSNPYSTEQIKFDKPLCLIAAGMGIAPCLSIMKYATDVNFKLGVSLLFVNRSSALPLQDEIEQLIGQLANSSLEVMLTAGLPLDDRLMLIENFLTKNNIGVNHSTYAFGPPAIKQIVDELLTQREVTS
jgi:ferredoxin-NADP reductase